MMRIINKRNQAGDTLVEVMFATAVLAAVLAGAFTLSNKATRISQTAYERTEVSNLMQREAELIRAKYMKGSKIFWSELTKNGFISASHSNAPFCDVSARPTQNKDNVFYLDDELKINKSYDNLNTFKDATPNDLFSIWVEAVNKGHPVTHTDFYIYACWEGIGSEGVQNSGLVMRISR